MSLEVFSLISDSRLTLFLISIEAALREHSSGGGPAGGAPLFPGSGHTLSGAPAPGAGGEANMGYIKVIAIVGLLWLWYSYSNSGSDQPIVGI